MEDRSLESFGSNVDEDEAGAKTSELPLYKYFSARFSVVYKKKNDLNFLLHKKYII
jgi:hypothetical protein